MILFSNKFSNILSSALVNNASAIGGAIGGMAGGILTNAIGYNNSTILGNALGAMVGDLVAQKIKSHILDNNPIDFKQAKETFKDRIHCNLAVNAVAFVGTANAAIGVFAINLILNTTPIKNEALKTSTFLSSATSECVKCLSEPLIGPYASIAIQNATSYALGKIYQSQSNAQPKTEQPAKKAKYRSNSKTRKKMRKIER